MARPLHASDPWMEDSTRQKPVAPARPAAFWASAGRIGVLVAAFAALSLSVRACHSLPALKEHPVYSFVARQRSGSVLPR